MNTNIVTKTDGTGHWSSRNATLFISNIVLAYVADDGGFGELRAYFNKDDWNTFEDGLVYTDECWLESFRLGLLQTGLSNNAVSDVQYSEQGMQGQNYVSMDVGKPFIAEYQKLIEERKIKYP